MWLFGIVAALVVSTSIGKALNEVKKADLSDFSSQTINLLEHHYSAEVQDIRMQSQKASGGQDSVSLPIVGRTLAAIGSVAFLLIWAVHYVGVAVLIRHTSRYLRRGTRSTLKECLTTAWWFGIPALILYDLAVIILMGIAGLIIVGLMFLPLIAAGRSMTVSMGVRTADPATLTWIAILIIAVLALLVFQLRRKFYERARIIDGRGILNSYRLAVDLIKHNLKKVMALWLVTAAANLLGLIAMITLAWLLSPAGTWLGNQLAPVVYKVLSPIQHNSIRANLAFLSFHQFYLFVVGTPMLIICGLFELFKSTAWTALYHHLEGVASVAEAPMTEGGQAAS